MFLHVLRAQTSIISFSLNAWKPSLHFLVGVKIGPVFYSTREAPRSCCRLHFTKVGVVNF